MRGLGSHLVLWWIPAGSLPTLQEAGERLMLLDKVGLARRRSRSASRTRRRQRREAATEPRSAASRSAAASGVSGAESRLPWPHAAQVEEGGALLLGLHALGDHAELQRVGDGEHGPHDAPVGVAERYAADE